MSNEKWDYSYLTLQCGDQRYTLKVVHYQSFGEFAREWYRIYPQDFDMKKMASEQVFGFGKTLEEAFRRYVATLVMERKCARGA